MSTGKNIGEVQVLQEPRVSICFRLSAKYSKALLERAREEGRSRGDLIRQAISEYFSFLEYKEKGGDKPNDDDVSQKSPTSR